MQTEPLRFDTLLKGGTLVDPAASRHGAFDVAVTGARIAAVEIQELSA